MEIIVVTLLYCITRLPFMHSFPVYYDSFEYVHLLERLQWNTVTSVISSSHQPIHSLYLLTALGIKSLIPFTTSGFQLVFLSFLFGYGTLIVWYFALKLFVPKHTAFFATTLCIFFPLFFLTNTYISYESELLFLQVSSVYFLLRGIKKKEALALFLSGIMLGLAELVFIGTLFIVPLYIVAIAITSLQFLPLFIIGTLLSGVGGDVILLNSIALIIGKYSSHAYDVVSASQGIILLIARALRNIYLQSVSIFSPFGAIIFVVVIGIELLHKKSKMVTVILLSCIPYILLMQYWHAGLYGRLACGIIFPASLLLALIIKQRKYQILVLLVLISQFVFIVRYQSSTPLVYRSYHLIQNEKNIAVITSDFNRFLYEQNNILHFSIKGTTTLTEIRNFINSNLGTKKVIIDSSALRYPYFQFDGVGYSPVSINAKGTPLIGGLLSKYKTELYRGTPTSQLYFLTILRNK